MDMAAAAVIPRLWKRGIVPTSEVLRLASSFRASSALAFSFVQSYCLRFGRDSVISTGWRRVALLVNSVRRLVRHAVWLVIEP